jgi:hypothetical protein
VGSQLLVRTDRCDGDGTCSCAVALLSSLGLAREMRESVNSRERELDRITTTSSFASSPGTSAVTA